MLLDEKILFVIICFIIFYKYVNVKSSTLIEY